MALKDIITALETEAHAQHQDLLARAKKQAEQIISEANREAEVLTLAEEDRISSGARNEEAKIIHQADFERLTALVKARESSVAHVLEEARDRLVSMQSGPQYREVFRSLATEAWESAAALGSERVVLVGQADKRLADSVLGELSLKADIETNDIYGGGVVIASPDKRQRLVNTLLGRLDKATPFVKAQISRILFDQ